MSRPTSRRVAALAGVVGALLGSGITLHASADTTSTASTFVPMLPCRLLDTRPLPDNVGNRGEPLGPGDTLTITIWGAYGHCQIPPRTTALSMNVVAVNPTASSYLTVFPGGSDRPLASSLNWVAGQPPTPNAVKAALSPMGLVSFFNNAGSVDLAVDIVGFYRPAEAGPTGAQGPTGPSGPSGPTGSGVSPANIVWVASSGAPFTTLSQALASITDNDSNHRYVVMIAPGTYAETSTVMLKDFVDVGGAGQDLTTITCRCSGAPDGATVEASGPLHMELRDLTVTNNGGPGTTAIGLMLSGVGATTSIVDTTITATEDTSDAAQALYIEAAAQPHLDRLNVYVAGASSNIGIMVNYPGSYVVVRNSWVYSTGTSIFNGSTSVRLVTSTVNGTTLLMSGRCDLVLDINGSPFTCT